MATRTLSGFAEALRRREAAAPLHPLVHRRRMSAIFLIGSTLALGIVLVAAFGPEVLSVYLPGLPVAFVLLWGSTDALRFDEREPYETSPS